MIMYILLLFAFLAGIVTVLSPCILPVLPLLLSAGIGQGQYRPYGIIIGLIVSFTFFTLALTAIVHATGISPNILRYIAIVLITFFGLTMIFPRLEQWFSSHLNIIANLGQTVEVQSQHAGTGFWSGFILGGALGLIWSPCAGPILAAITTLVATSAITWSAVLVTFAYSLGTALPMFFIIYGGNKIANSTTAIAPYTEMIRKIFGTFMILGALTIAFHFDVILQQIALKYFPMVTIGDNPVVQKELEKLSGNTLSPAPVIGSRAPDFVGISNWINSKPLNLEQLYGKVILVDFWTYSCINCVRTLPYLKEWYKKYADKGFIIVGVHTPEFEFEKDFNNVKDAVKRFDLLYPIALDNNYSTWRNFHNRYWPAHFIIDQNGIVQYMHFGEGEYITTENKIRSLLNLSPVIKEEEKVKPEFRQTPETYLGFLRAQNYIPQISLKKNETAEYAYQNGFSND